MNFRTTFILFGVLLAMLFVFGIVVEVRKGVLDEGFLFPEIHNADLKIDTMELIKDNKTYSFVKGKKGWTMSPPGSAEKWRIQDTKMQSIISEVKKVRKNEEADVVRDFSKAGLDSPELTVSLVDQGGKKFTLYVGKKSADKANVFVRSSERPRRVFAVRTADLEDLFVKDMNELRARDLLDVSGDTGRALTITNRDTGKTLALERTKEARWQFEEPAYGIAAFSRTGPGKDLLSVKKLLDVVGDLSVEKTADFESRGNKGLSEFGVTQGKETLLIEVKRAKDFLGKETVTEKLWIGNKVGKQYFARLEGDNYVVRIDAAKLEPVFKAVSEPESLRSYDLAFFQPSEVDAVDIQAGAKLKQEVKLYKTAGTEWKMVAGGKTYQANQVTIDGEKSLLSALQGQGKVKKFFDAKGNAEAKKFDAKFGFDNPTAIVSVFKDAVETATKESKKDKKKTKEKEPESQPKLKKDARPLVKLVFGQTAKDVIYVKRIPEKGPVTRMSVPADILAKVVPPQEPYYLAFLKKGLPSFNVTAADKIVLVRGSEKFVVEKKKKETKKGEKKKADKKLLPESNETWTMLEPKDLPNASTDETSIGQVLMQLATLQVEKWVKKIDPKKDDLSAFGLKNPAVKVTVTIKDKDKKETSRTYLFGNKSKTDKDKGVYALVSGTDIVFLTNAAALDFLKNVELRDRTIFTFAPDEVREIALHWLLPKNIVNDLELKRKSAEEEWKVEKLGGYSKDRFTLLSQKTDRFLLDISHLKAQRFISFKGEPSSDQKLSPKNAALRVIFKLADGKTKTLTIGAKNKENTGYYALANTLPNVVFLVDKDPFAAVLEGVGYFNAKSEE